MRLVVPPTLRPVEPQFSPEALRVSYGVASFRVHAERAIGTTKQRRLVAGKSLLRQLNLLAMALQWLCNVSLPKRTSPTLD